jgi:hypothetical protein
MIARDADTPPGRAPFLPRGDLLARPVPQPTGSDEGPPSPDAAAILARGQAEAKSMDARAEAFGTYGEAAILDLLVKVLPEVVGAAAAPLSAVDKMTVISADGVVHVPVVSADGDGPPKA